MPNPRGMTLIVTWSGGRCERFTVRPGDRVVVGTGAVVATVPLSRPDGPELVTVEVRGDECPGLVLVEQEVTPDPEVRVTAAMIVDEGWDADAADTVVSGTGLREAAIQLYPQGGHPTLSPREWQIAVIAEVERQRAAADGTIEVLDLVTGQLGAVPASSPAAYPGGNPALTYLLAEDIDGATIRPLGEVVADHGSCKVYLARGPEPGCWHLHNVHAGVRT